MYQETLALGDNPFDPKNFEGKPECSESLGRLPLRVDLCEKVADLYCEKLEKICQLEAEFKEKLRQEGYSTGKKRSNSSFVVIVRGPQGSGKTTLASKFLKILHETGQPGDPDWVSKATEFRDISLDDQQLSGDEIGQTLEKLKQQITSSSDKLHVSALIDNVTETAIGEVLKLFRQLSDRRRVFILTAHDLKLLDKNLALYTTPIKDFRLTGVDPESAVVYAKARIEYFRDPPESNVALCDHLFPFLENAIRDWTMPREQQHAGTENILVMRVLNLLLSEKIQKLDQKMRTSQRNPSDVILAELITLLNSLTAEPENG